MTYGLQLPNFTFSGVPDAALFDHVVGMARAAEDAGFESIWVMDHFYQLPPLGGASQPMLEAYTLLGALAARTSTARLGALVTGVTYRNPAILAKQVTTLDVISGGRAVLGIGAAWHDVEHEGLGVDFPPVGERMDRLEEALQICRAMFREDAPSFEGRYYRIKEARNVPRPVQPGGPPIMVGGSGPRRTLRLVARYADLCNISGDPEGIRSNLEILHRHCAEVGRDPAEITVTRLGSLMLTPTAEAADQLTETLRQLMGADDVRRAFTIGDAESVTQQVQALADAGVQALLFNLPLATTAEEIASAGEVLAKALQ